MIELIVSGGQSGADLAGNIFAANFSIDTEIRTFTSFKPTDAADWPVYSQFRKHFIPELDSLDYIPALKARTRYNVVHSDATVLFIHSRLDRTKGSLYTFNLCGYWECRKPVIAIAETAEFTDSADELRRFLTRCRPKVLNIAGERDMDKDGVVAMLSYMYSSLDGAGW